MTYGLEVQRSVFSGSVYRRDCAQARRHDRRGRGQERDEHVGGIEAALIGGAEHTREDLLAVGAAGGAIAAAAHFARDDGGPQRVFGAPIGGVERRVEEKAEDGVEFDDEMLLKAAHRGSRRLGVRASRRPSRSM